jgi:hypothetical protein
MKILDSTGQYCVAYSDGSGSVHVLEFPRPGDSYILIPV